MMVKGYHNTPSTLGDMVNWQLFLIGQNSSNDVCVVIHNYMTGWYLRSESANSNSFVISFYHYLYRASDVMVVL